MENVRSLLCSCCGGRTIGRQWHNRDTGFGLCDNCIDFCEQRSTEEEMKRNYGVKGVHYGLRNAEAI